MRSPFGSQSNVWPAIAIDIAHGHEIDSVGPKGVAERRHTVAGDIRALTVPQFARVGTDFFPDQSDNFFVGNSFPTCGINFTAQEIMGQTKENQ